MTLIERRIHDSILKKLRERIAQEHEFARRAYLLGLEAGELIHGDSAGDREGLQRNLEKARIFGVQIKTINKGIKIQ